VCVARCDQAVLPNRADKIMANNVRLRTMWCRIELERDAGDSKLTLLSVALTSVQCGNIGSNIPIEGPAASSPFLLPGMASEFTTPLAPFPLPPQGLRRLDKSKTRQARARCACSAASSPSL
jgi:hypothetical protein